MKSLTFFLLFIISFLVTKAQPNVKPDRKIGKNEFEVAIIPGYSDRGAMVGIQVLYRFKLPCMFKLGGGFNITTDEYKGSSTHPAVFIDLAKFVGNKQKWIFDGQVGKGFYSTTDRSPGVNGAYYETDIKSEMFYQISSCYRMNIGKKVSFFAGPFFHLQTFKTHTKVWDGTGQQLNPFIGKQYDGGGGLRFGFIF